MHGQWWRLITAGFLHSGILHILMNSWVLFDLGAEVETLYGTSRLIVFYFVSTVTGFAASSHMDRRTFLGGLVGGDLWTDRRDAGVRVHGPLVARDAGEVTVHALGDLRTGVELPAGRGFLGARGRDSRADF